MTLNLCLPTLRRQPSRCLPRSMAYFMAKDMASLKLKMRYEVVPLIKEYIKDGILRSMPDDDKYFECWQNAECYRPSETDYMAE